MFILSIIHTHLGEKRWSKSESIYLEYKMWGWNGAVCSNKKLTAFNQVPSWKVNFPLSDMIRLLLHMGSKFEISFFSFFFFFYFYIAFIVSISHFCPCLYYICAVQKVHLNYPVWNKSRWAETSYFYVLRFQCGLVLYNIACTLTQRGKKYLDLFVWDSTIAMSDDKMETAMMLLPTHRATQLSLQRCLPL